MAKSKRVSVSATAGITQLQYEEALAKYAAKDAEKCKIEAEIDAQLTEIRQEYESDLNLIVKEKDLLLATIHGYCVRNRDSLFIGKKSLDTLHGTLGFRNNPPSLTLLKGFKWEIVLENLKEKKLTAYVRTVEEANKEKLLADREKEGVCNLFPELGVKVSQDEKFFIELKKEEVAATA